jgi:hypothetical protein
MHINNLPIPPAAIQYCRDDHQRISVDEVPYASLVLAVRRLGDEVEFESCGKMGREEQYQRAPEDVHAGCWRQNYTRRYECCDCNRNAELCYSPRS